MASKKSSQRFLPEYTQKFPEIRSSSKSLEHAFCSLCNKHFKVSHGGISDVKAHSNTKQHKDLAKLKSEHKDISIPFNSTDKIVIKAECQMAIFLVEHDLPLSTSNHLSELVGVMFPMSSTAKSFKSKRTKTTCIVKELSNFTREQIVSKVTNKHFSIATDGSSDKGAKRQLYPFLIRFYDKDLGKIVTEILSIPAIAEDSTGENIYKLLDKEMSKFKLDWSQVVSFCSDNASCMMGRTKGVAAYILKQNEQSIMFGCLCHLIVIAAQRASKKLSVTIEDVLLDIMYHLKGSSKRNRQFVDIKDACGLDDVGLLNYCPTRWLSLGQCIPRILYNYDALLTFFGKGLKADEQGSEKRPGPAKPHENPPTKKAKLDGVDKRPSEAKTSRPDVILKASDGSLCEKSHSKTHSGAEKGQSSSQGSNKSDHHSGEKKKSHKEVRFNLHMSRMYLTIIGDGLERFSA